MLLETFPEYMLVLDEAGICPLLDEAGEWDCRDWLVMFVWPMALERVEDAEVMAPSGRFARY